MAEEIIMYVNDLYIQILAGVIIAAIVGAASSSFIFYRCLHKQARGLKLMKKATAFVIGRFVEETKRLHPEKKDEIEDLEKTYKDLIDDSK